MVAKGKGVGVWVFKGEKGIHMEIETQILGKQSFANLYRDHGAQKTLVSSPCLVTPTKPSPIVYVDISGVDALPGPGHLSKWYQLWVLFFSQSLLTVLNMVLI